VSPVLVGALVFVATFGGALAGMWLRRVLPEPHLSADSVNTVKVCVGLIATMTALVLGLVTAAAKTSFESVDKLVKNSAADVMTFDRILDRYGPETRPARDALYESVTVRLSLTWPEDPSASIDVATLDSLRGGERVVSMIRSLAPETEEQRSLQTRALNMGEALLAERWALSGTLGSSVLEPFLVAVVLWLAITFTSFGLFAPTNATVIAALGVSSLSVAGAVFLVLEMDGPFDGLITVSPEPWRYLQAWLRQ
jgi:hypothetical protein